MASLPPPPARGAPARARPRGPAPLRPLLLPEIISGVYRFCDIKTLGSSCVVCRVWAKALDDEAWEAAAFGQFAWFSRKRPRAWSGYEFARRLGTAQRDMGSAASGDARGANRIFFLGGSMSTFRDFCSSDVLSFAVSRQPSAEAGAAAVDARGDPEYPPFFEWHASLPYTLSAVGYARDHENAILAVGGWDGALAQPYNLVLAEGAEGWVEEEPMNTRRCFHSLAVLNCNSRLAMGGGVSVWQGASVFKSCEVYGHYNMSLNANAADADKSWADFTGMGVGRCGAVAVSSLGGDIFVVGGYGGEAMYHCTAEMLRPGAERWERLPDMQFRRTGLGVCYGADNAIYAIGGSPDGSRCHRTVERLDPREPSWQQVASLRAPRAYCAATIGPSGQIFVAGGETESVQGSATLTLRTVETFDTRKVGSQWQKFGEVLFLASIMSQPNGVNHIRGPTVKVPWGDLFRGSLKEMGKLDNALVYRL
uniref:F-box domain-containing protein n=1 Tax=Phaeomonas parva TaxID=124430 RepID=A0A6U4IKR1_9STRA|mmetsp:Transcript_40248/g.125873  ORF Transcript_40248/g.125873 Transcript_40248/m.125873 type:complete len:480 (+) Transcript_40248:167-1606(+)